MQLYAGEPIGTAVVSTIVSSAELLVPLLSEFHSACMLRDAVEVKSVVRPYLQQQSQVIEPTAHTMDSSSGEGDRGGNSVH